MSDSFDLVWSPSGRILYQQAGNQNYYELNPETREERLLIGGKPPGWMFSPVYSPDGRRVAVQWNRPDRGIWVIDTETGRQTLVSGTTSSMMPIGWSADATAIYAVEAKPSRYRGVLLPLGETSTEASIVRVILDTGRVETVARVPFEEIGTVAMTRDAARFIVSVYSSRSDVWVVDDFDSTLRLASRLPHP